MYACVCVYSNMYAYVSVKAVNISDCYRSRIIGKSNFGSDFVYFSQNAAIPASYGRKRGFAVDVMRGRILIVTEYLDVTLVEQLHTYIDVGLVLCENVWGGLRR